MDNVIDEFSLARDRLAKDIIGEIVLAEESGRVIKKWRGIFKISQKALAGSLGITPSVISDYESGRRRSPGIRFIRKYVNALLDADARAGGKVIRSFGKPAPAPRTSDAVMDIKEFSSPIDVGELCRAINANVLTKRAGSNHEIYGYTIIDSLKAITEFSFQELIRLYGTTTQRALIFTRVSTGRTPMVAIKMTNLRPGVVILHGLDAVDEVAKRIAEAESIPLALCRMERAEDIMEKLRGIE